MGEKSQGLVYSGGSNTLTNRNGRGIPPSRAMPHWLAHIGVEDAAAATAKAKSLGAIVVQDVMEVGDYGWMSVLTDPTGAAFALWQAKTPEQRGGD